MVPFGRSGFVRAEISRIFMKIQSRFRVYIPGFCVYCVLALSACSGDNGVPSGPDKMMQMPLTPVGVVTVKATDIPVEEVFVGRLAPFRSADIRARVPGVLQKRLYDEGTDVHQQQLLFMIDPVQLQAELNQREAGVAQAEANQINAVVALERAEELFAEKFVSQADYDNALAVERSSNAALKAAKAAVDNAKINLSYASVRSPIDGRAGEQQVTEGALVGQESATLLTTVNQIDPLYLNFSMSATNLDRVRNVQMESTDSKAINEVRQVQVTLPDGTLYHHYGVLDFSGEVIDPVTGSITLRAQVPNPDKQLLPGSFVTLKVVFGEMRGVFLVPQVAVQRDAVGAYVLTVADDKVVRKDIQIKHNIGNDWIVTSGIASGDRIIASGLQRVHPGQSVQANPWVDTQMESAGKQQPSSGDSGMHSGLAEQG